MSLSLTLLALTTIPTFAEPTEAQRVEALILVLQEKNPALRALAAEALGERGEAARAAIPALRQALHDPNGRVCDKAAVALLWVDDAEITTLTNALFDKRRRVSLAVAKAFQEMTHVPAGAVPGLIRCLRLPRNLVDVPPDTETLPVDDLMIYATLALGRCGRDAVPDLMTLLRDPHEEVRFCALSALGITGPKAAKAIPWILPLLWSGNEDVRAKAAFALCRIAPKSPEVIHALLAAIAREQARSKLESAIVEVIGQQGIAALPFCFTAQRYAEWPNFVQLLNLGPAGGLFLAAAMLEHEEFHNQFKAIWVPLMQELGESALPTLFKMLESPHAETRRQAVAALRVSGFDFSANFPTFLRMLDSQDPAMRLTGVEALHISGSINAIEALKAPTTDADPAVRAAAIAALKRLRKMYYNED